MWHTNISPPDLYAQRKRTEKKAANLLINSFCGEYRTRTDHLDTASVEKCADNQCFILSGVTNQCNTTFICFLLQI